MNKQDVAKKITELCPDAVVDVRGENCHFEVRVVSEFFRGKSSLQRQQPILALFREELSSGKLHALSVKAKSPDE